MADLSSFNKSDSVVVKSNTEDPDLGIDLAGWQGRFVELDKKERLVLIEWDNMTLKSMPKSLIEACGWEKYLNQALQFPFEARINTSHKGALQSGDLVRVKGISILDDSYGVIVELRLGRRRYDHPLHQISPTDEDHPNDQIIDDYST